MTLLGPDKSVTIRDGHNKRPYYINGDCHNHNLEYLHSTYYTWDSTILRNTRLALFQYPDSTEFDKWYGRITSGSGTHFLDIFDNPGWQ